MNNMERRLVWLDLESTGLDPKNDTILEIGIVITDGDLVELARKNWVLLWLKADRITDETVREMHTKSGLLAECEKSSLHLLPCVEEVTEFIEEHCGDHPEKPMLSGSSVHFDRKFLDEYLPEISKMLHYRHFDVSVLHRAAEMFVPELRMPTDDANKAHRALADVDHSISVAKWYRDHLFYEAMPTAAEEALDDIAAMCGAPQWSYPGQVVRDVRDLYEKANGTPGLIPQGVDGISRSLMRRLAIQKGQPMPRFDGGMLGQVQKAVAAVYARHGQTPELLELERLALNAQIRIDELSKKLDEKKVVQG